MIYCSILHSFFLVTKHRPEVDFLLYKNVQNPFGLLEAAAVSHLADTSAPETAGSCTGREPMMRLRCCGETVDKE